MSRKRDPLEVAETLQKVSEAMQPVAKPELQISGEDGNAFFILGRARKIALKNKMDWDAIQKEATAGDYDHLLQTMMKHFDVL